MTKRYPYGNGISSLGSFPGFKRGDKTSPITTHHHPRPKHDSATIAQLPLSLAREHMAVGSQPQRSVPATSLFVAELPARAVQAHTPST